MKSKLKNPNMYQTLEESYFWCYLCALNNPVSVNAYVRCILHLTSQN